VSTIGTRLLAALLAYSCGPAKPIVDGFIGLAPTTIAALCSDPAGSRLMDGFIDHCVASGKNASWVVAGLGF
jgi:hypothetical protein